MAQFLRPNSDVLSSNFVFDFQSIDEATPDDGDLVRTATGAITCEYICGLSAPGVSPEKHTGHTVRVRARQADTSFRTITVALRQGGTTLQTWDISSLLTTTFQTFELGVSTSAASGITDYGGLRIRLHCSPHANTTYFSWMEMQVPELDQTVSSVGGAGVASTANAPTAVRQLQRVSSVGGAGVASTANAPTAVRQAQKVSGVGGATVSASASTPAVSSYMPLAALLQDPSARMDMTVKIEGRHRGTGDIRTWWFSFLGRFTSPADDPASTSMPPYVISLGKWQRGLREDAVFSGQAEEGVEELVLRNDLSQLDDWREYSFAGRPVVAYLGGADSDHRGYEPQYTAAVDGEPLLGIDEVRVSLASANPELRKPLEYRALVGIPVAIAPTSSDLYFEVSYDAALDLESYAAVGRFKCTLPPASGVAKIFWRGYSGDWWLHLGILPSGEMRFLFSDASGQDHFLTTTGSSWADGKEHVVAVGFSGGEQFLQVDDVIVRESVPRTLYVPGALAYGMRIGQTWNGSGTNQLYDLRLYGRYLDEVEISSRIDSRASLDDPDLLSYWRCDDGLGDVLTDYKSGFDATRIAGTFDWVVTLQGEAEMAGQLVPAIDGRHAHAEARLVDGGQVVAGSNPRYQWTDDADSLNRIKPSPVYARGFELEEGVDYEIDGDTIEMLSAQDQPVTFGTVDNTLFFERIYPVTELAEHLLTGRGGVDGDAIDYNSRDALRTLAPWSAGLYLDPQASRQETSTYGAAVGHLLAGVHAHLRTSPEGKLRFGMLLPPVSPSPGGRPVLEHLAASSGIAFPGTNMAGGSHTVAGWFLSHALDYDPQAESDTVSPVPLGHTILTWTDDSTSGFELKVVRSSTSGRGALLFHQPGLTPAVVISPGGEIRWGRKYFLAATYSAGVRRLYLGEPGQTLRLIAEFTGATGTVGTDTGVEVNVGFNLVGTVSEVSVHDVALDLAALQTVMDTGAVEASARFHAPLDEGEGAVTVRDEITGALADIPDLGTRRRWAPRAIFDLRRLVSPQLTLKQMVPAWHLIVQAERNHRPLREEEIADAVTTLEALPLKRASRPARAIRRKIRDTYDQARAIELDSALLRQVDGQHLLEQVAYRYDEGRLLANLADAGRQALAVDIGDEVWIYANRYGLEGGAAFRVVTIRPTYEALTAELALWR